MNGESLEKVDESVAELTMFTQSIVKSCICKIHVVIFLNFSAYKCLVNTKEYAGMIWWEDRIVIKFTRPSEKMASMLSHTEGP